MSTSAIIMMILSMVIIWGGIAVSAAHAIRHGK
ncbi:MAG: methionine/alanine import family NSS transporter small subunit [Oscillospiraceae bacterium]|jgi:hypothetical protein|nr:methionine/alanine import family NSS transporter small subunit [Oscillospiraceae bacterium]